MRIAVPAFLCLGLGVAEAAVEISRTDEGVELGNEFVRLTVDLRHGARVTGFYYKPLDRQWLGPGRSLFADHVWQQTWPGELFDAPYEHEIVDQGPSRVAVKVWRTLQRQGQERLVGLRVERTLALTAGSPLIAAEVALTNPTDRVKTAGYWAQHIFRLGGLTDNFYIRPSATGLEVATMAFRADTHGPLGREWVKAPAAGWTAVVNPTTAEAAVFLMDYNELRWLYNCIGSYTAEWYYDLVRLAPGKRWSTTFFMLPLAGYRGISFASADVVADVRLMACAEGFRPVYTLGCARRPLAEVHLQAEWTGGRTGTETVSFKAVGYQPQEFVSALTLPAQGEPCVTKIALRGEGFAHTFEKHFGDYNRADRLTAGVFDTGYTAKRPAKQKKLDRPAEVRKQAHEGLAVYEARGQFFAAWRLAEALKALGQHTLQVGHFSCDVYGEQLDLFPACHEEIMGLDVVVLNNVSAEALSPGDQALLADYVRHGGGLLVLGGWYAFGGGRYADSALADLLPVESGKPFDIRWHRDGLALARGEGDLLSEADLADKPIVTWIQEVARVKPQARVAVRAADRPFIVLGTFGRGRVACVLASATGVSTAQGQVFFECARWPALLGRLIQWLRGD